MQLIARYCLSWCEWRKPSLSVVGKGQTLKILRKDLRDAQDPRDIREGCYSRLTHTLIFPLGAKQNLSRGFHGKSCSPHLGKREIYWTFCCSPRGSMVPGFRKEKKPMGENTTRPFRILFTLLQVAKLTLKLIREEGPSVALSNQFHRHKIHLNVPFSTCPAATSLEWLL